MGLPSFPSGFWLCVLILPFVEIGKRKHFCQDRDGGMKGKKRTGEETGVLILWI